MILLLVGIVLTIFMVFITRQLTNSLPPERFRSVIRLLLPAYLLLNLYFTLLMRQPSEDRLVTLVPLRSYFAVLGWDIQSFPVVGQLLQGAWEEPIAFAFALNIFWAFAEGFIKETAATLTEAEVNTLGISCFALACALATRFLDDYILGDKSFKIKYPAHNLVRTRCQIALAKDMRKKMDAMNAIARDCWMRYR